MPVDAATALDRLRSAAEDGRLDEVMERLGVDLLGAFGSAARGAPTPSDLDIGVRFRGRVRLLELIDALTVLTGYDRLDVAVVDGQHPVLDAEALVGVPLYESTPGAFAEAQMAALAHKRDTAWLRALDLARMAGT